MSDYKVRSDVSYEKDYLLGKYGEPISSMTFPKR